MLFQSIRFIYLFLPVTLTIFLLLNGRFPKAAKLFLIICSLLFCGYTDLRAVFVLVLSAFFTYSMATLIIRENSGFYQRKLWLTVGIALNFLLLSWYKFSPINQDGLLLKDSEDSNILLEVGVPLGLSFYTLYQISLLVDIYRKKAELCDFRSYFLSVSMFAHLPAGPILRYKTSVKQFMQVGAQRVWQQEIAAGMSLFTFGLFKKALLAEPMSIFTSQMFASINSGAKFSMLESLFTTWGFLLQLYFDFSAYSDMSIGIGLCFGLKFPINFNSPLKATSFSDYIGRWHISLLAFNREYIFMPVSKFMLKVLNKKSPFANYITGVVATIVVYISIGLWHSQSLHFLMSGILIGLVITIGQSIMYFVDRKFSFSHALTIKGNLFNQLRVLFFASAASSILVVKNFTVFKSLLAGYTTVGNELSYKVILNNITEVKGTSNFFPMIKSPVYLLGYQTFVVPFVFLLIICSFFALKGPNSMELFGLKTFEPTRWQRFLVWKPTLLWGVLTGLSLGFYYLIKIDSRIYQDFIYGQF